MPSFTRTFNHDNANQLVSEVLVVPAFKPPPGATQGTIEGRKYQALWDTGATTTVITEQVAHELGLKPIDVAKVSHAGGDRLANVYMVDIHLSQTEVILGQVRVTEGILLGNIELLIGMDIIGAGDFAVTNDKGNTRFSYRIPHGRSIDFAVDELAARNKHPWVTKGKGKKQRTKHPVAKKRKKNKKR